MTLLLLFYGGGTGGSPPPPIPTTPRSRQVIPRAEDRIVTGLTEYIYQPKALVGERIGR